MAEADRFPLKYPGGITPAATGEAALRRVAKLLAVPADGRVLCVGAGGAALALYLAREFDAQMTVVDRDEKALAELLERARAHGLDGKFTGRQVDDYAKLPLPAGDFQAVVTDPCAPLPLEPLAVAYRPLLAPRGRLCATYPVRVGRTPNAHVLKFWEEKLGAPLVMPREALQAVERRGYEPQTVESLEDAALTDFYRQVEQHAGADDARAKEEVALFRSQAGRASATFAVLIARRKEPGEKPPPSRNE